MMDQNSVGSTVDSGWAEKLDRAVDEGYTTRVGSCLPFISNSTICIIFEVCGFNEL